MSFSRAAASSARLAAQGHHAAVRATAVLLAAAACARNAPAPAAPAPAAVEPAGAYTRSPVSVLIRGESFVPVLDQRLGRGSHLDVDASFRAWLGTTELSGVQWIDESALTAVVPAGLADGVYRLTVEGPFGRGTRELAFRASLLPPAQLSATVNTPARVAAGADFEATAQVSNTGGTALLQTSGGAPTVIGARVEATSVPAEAVALAPGAIATLRWRLHASSPGTASLAFPIGGRDEITAAQLAVSAPASVEVVAPAALVATALPLRATVEIGQAFTLAADVQNTGADLARAVAVALPAGLEFVAGPPARDLQGGATVRIELTVRALAPGIVRPLSSAAGTGSLDGAPLAAPLRWTDVLVQSPPSFPPTRVTLVPGARAAIGQEIDLTVVATNEGDGAASAVTPSVQLSGDGGITPLSIPSATDVPGHGSVTFVWRFSAAGAGTVAFAPQVAATDANTGAALPVVAASPPALIIEPPAALIGQASGPARAAVGRTIQIALAVQNTGGAAALSVLPSAPGVSGPLTPLSSPGAQDIAGGATASFVWSYRATAEGTATFAASASGRDADSGFPVSASAPPITIVVERPAALQILSFSVPAALSRGQAFTAKLVVANTGSAAANGFGATRPAVTATGGAAATIVGQSGPSVIPGGTSGTILFSCVESGTDEGTLALATTASATDADSALALSAGPATTAATAVQAPASLSILSFTLPQRLSNGQGFTAAMTLFNAGTAAALAVTPGAASVFGTGGAKATLVSAPATADVPGRSPVVFTWTFLESGSGAGTMQIHAGAAGTDANSGAAVAAPPKDSTTAAVDAPASLAVMAIGVPGALSRGQAFQCTVMVKNVGQATATGVLPTLVTLPPSAIVQPGGATASPTGPIPAAVDLGGGASATFTFSFVENGTAPGNLMFSGTASGTDANSGARLSAPARSSAAVPVMEPAALAITSFSIPASLSARQTFNATLVATNGGGATALAVLPAVPDITPLRAATAVASPAPVDLAPGASATFTWTYVESGAGSFPAALSLSTGIAGTDANSGATISAGPRVTNVATVGAGATLTVMSFTLPALVSRGQTVTGTLTVRNSGDATALAVTPQPDPPSVQASGNAALGPASSPQTPVDLAPGASAVFGWSYVENGTGPCTGASTGPGSCTLLLRTTLHATDINSGQSVIVTGPSASTVATIQTPASLSITSLVINAAGLSRGQAFTATSTVKNSGQAAATMVLPDPNPPSRLLSGGADATTASAQSPLTIAGGASATFVWNYLESGTGPGSIALSAAVRGADANSGAAISTPAATSAAVQVQEPARLEALLSAPQVISRGQAFVVSVLVRNTGGAIARGVVAAPSVVASGGAAASTSPAATPVDLAAGASTTFSFTFVEAGTASGSLSFSATATGSDANSSATVQAVTGPFRVLVQQRASLSAVFSMPSALTRGQTFSATLIVTNTGEAAAVSVLPGAVTVSPTGNPGPGATTSTTQAAVAIAGGASASFNWTFVENGAGTGSLHLSAQTTGTDGNDPSVSLTAVPSPASTVEATVLTPSRLSVSAFTIPTQLTRGQTFTASMRLTNNGGSTVDSVAPGAPVVTSTGGAAAATSTTFTKVSIAGGASATFTWTWVENGTGPGTIALSAGASGVDSVSGLTVTAGSTSSGVAQVQTGALLSVTAFSIPASIDRGQAFLATMTVANSGQAAARTVTPAAVAVVGTGGPAGAGPLPPAQDIPGGASVTFQWTLTESGTGPGTIMVQAQAQGTDGNSGAPTWSTQASTAAAQVQVPAALRVISLSAPATLSRGQSFTVTLVVLNVGGATAQGVRPSPNAPTVTATGGALAATTTAPPAATIVSGQQASFAWSFVESGTATGGLTFSVGATGLDGNTGAALAAPTPPVASAVQSPAALTVSSFTLRSGGGRTSIDRGQTFLATLVVTNSGDAAATGVLPNPAPPLLSASGGAAASTGSPVVPATISGGASATFTWSFTENGAAAGTLSASSGAQGQDANSGAALSATTASSNALAVQDPAALAITAFTVPSILSRGQNFTARMVVSNRGGATANAVLPDAPVVNATKLAHAGTASSPAATAIAAGGSATFTWTFTEDGSGDGTVSLTAGAAGTDANTGGAITALPSTTAAATVQRAALLSVSLTAPQAVSRGQAFTVSLTVTNTGEAAAAMVAPSPATPAVTASGGAAASTSSAATPVTIAGGAAATFSWTFVESGTASGALTFKIAATGTDTNSGLALQSQQATASALVQKPAVLAISSFTATSASGGMAIERGQGFTARLVVANLGEASAAGVVPAPLPPTMTTSGGAAAATSTVPQAVTIGGGFSATFAWNYVEGGSSTGTIKLTASVGGSDGNSQKPISSGPSTTAPLAVQQPPMLAAAIAAPSMVSREAAFNVTLIAANTGGTDVTAAAPALALSGTAGAAIQTGPTPPAANVPAGGSATFTWSLKPTASGALTLGGSLSGADAVTGAPVSTTARSAQVQISEAQSIAVNPFGDGTGFSYLFSHLGQIYLGPDRTGGGAVRMNPDGSSPQRVPWKLEAGAGARNTVYQPVAAGGQGLPCTTIGSLGCATNSAACGPDNEADRGLFFSGTIGGTDWYGGAGEVGSGGARFLYLTNGQFPLAAGGSDDLAYVDLKNVTGAPRSARTVTAAHAFRDRLYLGILDTSLLSPILLALVTMPQLPGLVAGATDLVDLGAAFLPQIGSKGILFGTVTDDLDAIADFNDALYIANNGGFARTTSNSPTACTLASCTGWVDATPSSASYTSQASLGAHTTASIQPAMRAVPFLVPFGGRFFAARNTKGGGPQLWSCNPALTGNPTQCDPGDWRLVAPTVSTGTINGDATQFENPDNNAVTLLAATQTSLYVGFDNAKSGIQIFRTTRPAAAVESDFTGQGGCLAGSPGCQGIGGDGLAAGMQQVYDSRALGFAGQDYLYVSAAGASGTVSVFRIAP